MELKPISYHRPATIKDKQVCLIVQSSVLMPFRVYKVATFRATWLLQNHLMTHSKHEFL